MNDPSALVRAAEDALKTSMFNWSADHLAAGALFERAGNAFRTQGAQEPAALAYERAAKSHGSSGGQGWEAQAKALDQAARCVPARAPEFFQKASRVFVEHGDLDGGADALGRAAAAMDALDAQGALDLHIKAADMVAVGDSFHKGLPRGQEILRFALNRLTKAKRLPDAVKVALKLQTSQLVMKQSNSVHKSHLILVVLYLARGDVAAAQKQLDAATEDSEFMRSDEYEACDDLLRAWGQFDGEKVKSVTHLKIVSGIEREVAMLARELDPVRGMGGRPPASLQPQSKPAQSSQAPVSKVAAAPAAPSANVEPQAHDNNDDDLPDLR
jgi:hypothetical protein